MTDALQVIEEGNLDAIDKVEANIELQISLKKKLIKNLVDLVNQICEEQGLIYFTMGHLLSYALSGNHEYLDGEEFLIGMLRKDYDKLFDNIATVAKEKGVVVKPFYTGGAANRKHSTLISVGTQKSKSENYRMLVTLRVEPFDELPDDPNKRREFIESTTKQGNNLRNKSFAILRRFKGALRQHRLYNPLRMGSDLITFAGLGAAKKRYHDELCRYQSDKEDSDVARLEFVAYPPHNKKEIFPVKKAELGGFELMLPNSPEGFQTSTAEEREKEIVESLTDTLRKIDEISRANDIKYCALGNLAVAARNAQGFGQNLKLSRTGIGLLRDDYDKLKTILRDGKSGLKLFETFEEYPHVYAESSGVIDEKSIKGNHQEDTPKILLFPLDAMPDRYEEQRAYKKQLLDSVDELIDIQVSEMGNNESNLEKTSEEQQQEMHYFLKKYSDENPNSKLVCTVIENMIRTYRREDIFPLKRSEFADFEIWTAANDYIEHEKIDPDYTEYIAVERTKILKKIDEICSEQDITYFAIAGLLIGATIYHDSMPESNGRNWDIGLLREDYNKFKDYMLNHGSEHGLQFNEYLDEEHKYHRLDCSVSNLGDDLSNLKINILPFDKIPEDDYLQMGFVDDMDVRNRVYREYICIGAGEMREIKVKYLEDFNYLQNYDLAKETAYIEERSQLFNDDERTNLYGRIAFRKSKFIPAEELFPLQRVKFRDIEINCPGDYTTWQPMLNDELQRQVHAIQKADLILLKEFDRVCQELGVGYFICGGTMLGYMRHGGFIPWDDDVDCAMLREDYDYFIKNAGKVLGDKFFLQTRETDETIPYVFSKIRLNDTEYITDYSDSRKYHQGICLDIFPFDFLPNDGRARGQLVREVIELRRTHNIAARLQYPIPDEEANPRNDIEKEYIENAKETLKKNWAVDLSKTQDAYIKKATSYNAYAKRDRLKTVASFAPTYTYIELQDLLPYQRGMFEGVEVSIPRRPDVFLEMQYGDYMQMPPPHMQVAHRLIKWSTWEESSEDAKANAEKEQ